MPSDLGGSVGEREHGFAFPGSGALGGPGLAAAGWLGRGVLSDSVFPPRERPAEEDWPEPPDWERIEAELRKKRQPRRVKMTRRRLWEAYRDEVRERGGNALSSSRFCHHLQACSGSDSGGELVFEYFPGKTGLADFSGKTLGLRMPVGTERSVEIFVSVLCCSRLVYVGRRWTSRPAAGPWRTGGLSNISAAFRRGGGRSTT